MTGTTDYSEQEEYILTSDEENEAISFAIERAKEHRSFLYREFNYPDELIKFRLSQINWDDEIDKEKILKTCNSNKQHAIWERSQRVIEKEEKTKYKKELKEYWTSSMLYSYLKVVSKTKFNTTLIANEDTLRLIKILCFFIAEDSRFETELGYDLKKGLLLRGACGLGKTYIPTCLKDNGLKPLTILNLIEITDEVKLEGEYVMPEISGILYLDDVGTEQTPIKHFGTVVNWFKDFFELYYSKKLPFNKLILSTNLNGQEIEEKYGYRVRSRMRDVFNDVYVTGKDFR